MLTNLKKLFTAGLIMIACAFPMSIAASKYNSVEVVDANGKATIFELSRKPVLTFTDEGLKMTDGNTTVIYPSSQPVKFLFTEEIISGTKQIQDSNKVAFRIDNNLYASGLNAGENVTIFLADGKFVASGIADSDGNISLEIPDIHGIFIIKTSASTFKFIK